MRGEAGHCHPLCWWQMGAGGLPFPSNAPVRHFCKWTLGGSATKPANRSLQTLLSRRFWWLFALKWTWIIHLYRTVFPAPVSVSDFTSKTNSATFYKHLIKSNLKVHPFWRDSRCSTLPAVFQIELWTVFFFSKAPFLNAMEHPQNNVWYYSWFVFAQILIPTIESFHILLPALLV